MNDQFNNRSYNISIIFSISMYSMCVMFVQSFEPRYNRTGWLGVKHQVTYLSRKIGTLHISIIIIINNNNNDNLLSVATDCWTDYTDTTKTRTPSVPCCTHRPFDVRHEGSVLASPADTGIKIHFISVVEGEKSIVAACSSCDT